MKLRKLRMIKLIDLKEELDGTRPILSKDDLEYIKSNQYWTKDHYMGSLIPVDRNFTDLKLGKSFDRAVNSDSFRETEIMSTPYEMEKLTRMANLMDVPPIERNIYVISMRLFEDAMELNNHKGLCDYKNKTDLSVCFAPIKERLFNQAIVYNYIIGQYNDMQDE